MTVTFRDLFPPKTGVPLEPIASRVPEMHRLQQSVSQRAGRRTWPVPSGVWRFEFLVRRVRVNSLTSTPWVCSVFSLDLHERNEMPTVV